MTRLRLLKASRLPVERLPPCLGMLEDLQVLDVRGHAFRGPDAIPEELGRLSELREFIAFGKGRIDCPTKEEHEKNPRTPSWDSKWRCRSGNWAVRFDDETLPWWRWRKLTKFWADQNWFEGTVPELLATAWPRLSRLDLYDNALEGALPGNLADLPLLTLQLHNNRLSGQVPDRLHARCIQTLTLHLNEHLDGCIPEQHATVTVSARGIPGHLQLCRHNSGNAAGKRPEL
eukprot:gb/GFBE01068157.1/.p1 GENE.gb/GFBE01068157.1/~~gb/GFBE01068157.1/.p1  ORF type:complete len:231 (+),score=34.60 gb/GFBE01068157.1/:1-693(+)